MAAVIQRVVTVPTVRTEYLSSVEPEAWAEKKHHAYVFKTHALADELAARLRQRTQAERRENGSFAAAFVHARNLGNFEWKEFASLSGGVEDLAGAKPADQHRHAESGVSAPAHCNTGPKDGARSGSSAPPAQEGEVVVRMDPKRAAEVLRDPVEAY